MLQIPFPLETVPADRAETALTELIARKGDVTPVLLGDADVFSMEWAEQVDEFEDPEDILADARALDIDAWFANRLPSPAPGEAGLDATRKVLNGVHRVASVPVDVVLMPVRALSWPINGKRPNFRSRALFQGDEDKGDYLVDMLRNQLAELEAAGEGTPEELAEIRDVIDEIEADGPGGMFPDPVAYVTPRRGGQLAAGLLSASEPWEGAAWLQHGAYAICAPKAVFVAHCRWLWEQHRARIITASTDHIGFQMERPLGRESAAEVLARFAALGATEINGDHAGSDGESLVGASRLWVWWD